jgi:hypothetical protein
MINRQDERTAQLDYRLDGVIAQVVMLKAYWPFCILPIGHYVVLFTTL